MITVNVRLDISGERAFAPEKKLKLIIAELTVKQNKWSLKIITTRHYATCQFFLIP